jgi:2-succinyl-6-hydroxy-2,4-cyclohexadiene-1-carboxylate synthase
LIELNGLEFHVETEGAGPALLLLHGFTGSVRSWDAIRPALAAFARVIAVDLVGHGRSAAPADARRYTMAWAARDVCALLDRLGVERAHALGYSMGGRVALHFGVAAPQRVASLVLESASPGIQDETERARRVASDAALAERVERDGIEAFVDQWERQPLLALAPHVSDQIRARQRAERLANQPNGLANSLRGMGAGAQAPVWDALQALDCPVTLISGELDMRYGEIAHRMSELLPRARLTVSPNAGHTVHLDQPEWFVEQVRLALKN